MKPLKLSCLTIIMFILVFDLCFAQEGFQNTISAPVYAGGFSALKDFIKQNIKYPEDSKREGIGGIVTLSYIVNTKGKIENIKILRGLDAKCDSEAVRVTRLITGWKPAVQFGRPVSVKVIMPVEFLNVSKKGNEQTINVSGSVIDKSNGKPIEGVLVIIKGTNNGASTDKNGMYNLAASGQDSELEFSSMGYKIQSEKVSSNRTINVELMPEDIIIDFTSK